MHAYVPQGADGNVSAGRFQRDSAAIGVGDRDDIIDVRESRQQFLFNAADRIIHRRRDALDSGRNPENILCSHAPVAVAMSLKRQTG